MRWRDVWQVPVLGVGAVLLVGGIVTLAMRTPKPDLGGPIGQAEAMLAKDEHAEALKLLNEKILPYVGTKALTREQEQEFHLLRARGIHQGQKALGIVREDNNLNVVGQYSEAERKGASLSPQDLYQLGDALADLGRIDEAVRRAEALPAAHRAWRTELYRKLVDRTMSSEKPNHELALDLVARVSADQAATADEKVWAALRQGEVLLAQGYADRLIGRLLPMLPGFSDAEARVQGELGVLLARAYLESGQVSQAAGQLERASKLISEDDPLMGRVLVLLGQVRELQAGTDARESLSQAREFYRKATSRFIAADVVHPGLLGLAEVEARLSLMDDAVKAEESVATYLKLVEDLRTSGRHGGITGERVAESLMSRFRERFDTGRPQDAASAGRFAALAETLFAPDKVPSDVLFALAESARRSADEKLVSAGMESRMLRDADLSSLDAATRSEVKQGLLAAGDYYRRHARSVVLGDSESFGRSLWLAAECYDRSGNTDDAVNAFQEFGLAFPTDPKQGEARWRLGRALQARGDLEAAAEQFRALLNPSNAQAAGPFGDASYVPLAQVLLLDKHAENDTEAEDLLLRVASGEVGGVDNPHFRAALWELSKHYYETGEHEKAIARHEELLERFPTEAGVDTVRFRLADVYRRSASDIARTLKESMPDTERRRFETLRGERLRRSMALFAQVRDTLDQRAGSRTGSEELHLRHAFFYIGDCAFELGDYEQAVRLYDAARERYPNEPDTLVALAQIVSAHLRQGDVEKARTANERAKRFYRSLPESVWQNSSLPMKREDWERWLESTDKLTQLAGTSEGPPGP